MALYKNYAKKVSRPAQPFGVRQVATGTHIFCDGACEPNPGAGGWGFVVYLEGNEIFHARGGAVEATNNTMELTGMLEALRWMKRSVMLSRPVTIWCDSMYVVNGCNDWRHKWKKQGWSRKGQSAKPGNGALANVDLWKAIDELLNQCSAVTIKWVKGHNGTAGNERADKLSNEGRAMALAAAGVEDTVEVEDHLTAEYRQIMGQGDLLTEGRPVRIVEQELAVADAEYDRLGERLADAEADQGIILEALESMLRAVCGETGFAAAVRTDAGKAYPWPALDVAEQKARAALEAIRRAR